MAQFRQYLLQEAFPDHPQAAKSSDVPIYPTLTICVMLSGQGLSPSLSPQSWGADPGLEVGSATASQSPGPGRNCGTKHGDPRQAQALV